MSDQTSHMQTQFIRQRRNLLIISLLLGFAQIADLQIKQEITVFGGVVATIGNPWAISFSLWMFWAYWLYRYYVYHMESGRGEFRERHKRIFMELIQANRENLVRFDPNIERHLTENNSVFVGASVGQFDLVNEKRGSEMSFRAPHLAITKKMNNDPNKFLSSSFGEDYVATIPWKHLATLHNKARYIAVIDTPVVTDYYVPYFIATLPLVLVLVRYIIALLNKLPAF